MNRSTRIGFVHNQLVPSALQLVMTLVEHLRLGDETWIRSAGELEKASDEHPGVDLIITVGGDGTILRAVRIAALYQIPILGINMGRVGFMTELGSDVALESIDSYLRMNVRVEERGMVQASVVSPSMSTGAVNSIPSLHALNEVVVGNIGAARMVEITVKINDAPFTVYHADSVIVATATGSTGYALSAGGAILHPLSKDMLLKPVAAQLGFSTALALPADTKLELEIDSDHPAILSADGFIERDLQEGTRVFVEVSPHKAYFLRMQPAEHYYSTLIERLAKR